MSDHLTPSGANSGSHPAFSAMAGTQYAADLEAVRRKLMTAGRARSDASNGQVGIVADVRAAAAHVLARALLFTTFFLWACGGLLLLGSSVLGVAYWTAKADIIHVLLSVVIPGYGLISTLVASLAF